MRYEPKATAPRDGTVFIGKNSVTGNEYDTWYEEKKPLTPADGAMAKILLGDDGGLWWCRDNAGRVTSFCFDVWRNKRL